MNNTIRAEIYLQAILELSAISHLFHGLHNDLYVNIRSRLSQRGKLLIKSLLADQLVLIQVA